MNAPRLPGNEPDSGDMFTDPITGAPADEPNNELPEDEADKLGNFA